jgi:hypothetical protein
MSTQQYLFSNFGDLYRAAFAESNPSTKQLLLAEVKRVLDHWQETEGRPSTAGVDSRYLDISQAT